MSWQLVVALLVVAAAAWQVLAKIRRWWRRDAPGCGACGTAGCHREEAGEPGPPLVGIGGGSADGAGDAGSRR